MGVNVMVMLVGIVVALVMVQVAVITALLWACSEIKAMQKSTHSIQFVPAEDKFQAMTDQVKDALNKDLFENVG